MKFEIYDIANGHDAARLVLVAAGEDAALAYVITRAPSFWAMSGGGVLFGRRHYENAMVVYETPGGVRYPNAILLVIAEDSVPPWDGDRIRRTFTNERWRWLPSKAAR